MEHENSKKPAPGSTEEAGRATRRKQESPTRTQWVRATTTGYYDLVRRREGAEFTIDPKDYGTKWMVAIRGPGGDEDVAKSDALAAAADASRIELAATNLQERSLRSGVLLQRDPKEIIEERVKAAKQARERAGIKERDAAAVDDRGRATNRGELRRGDFTHPDTGSAPSSGIGTNLNPAPYGQDKVDKAKGSHRDKDAV